MFNNEIYDGFSPGLIRVEVFYAHIAKFPFSRRRMLREWHQQQHNLAAERQEAPEVLQAVEELAGVQAVEIIVVPEFELIADMVKALDKAARQRWGGTRGEEHAQCTSFWS